MLRKRYEIRKEYGRNVRRILTESSVRICVDQLVVKKRVLRDEENKRAPVGGKSVTILFFSCSFLAADAKGKLTCFMYSAVYPPGLFLTHLSAFIDYLHFTSECEPSVTPPGGPRSVSQVAISAVKCQK